MTDIAKEAGVSQTTVSFVLNNVKDANISQQTWDKVIDTARKLGYSPNVPKYFRSKQNQTITKTIGFITDEIGTSSYGGEALKGAQEAAWKNKFMLIMLNTEGIRDIENAAVNTMLERQVDGIVLATMIRRELKLTDRHHSIPCVTMNGYCVDSSVPVFTTDEIQGGKTATAMLLEAGHRRIGFLNGEMWMDAAQERLSGYKNALEEAGISFDPEIVRDGNWRPDSGYKFAKELLTLPDPPTAFFCGNDLIALGAYEAIRESGLRIPKDISIVGYDDQEIASYIRPPLSTIRLPYYEMGKQSVLHLLKIIIKEEPAEPFQKKLPGVFVRRESIAPPHN